MFRLIKSLITLALIGGFIWFGFAIPLGKYTLFQHLRRIWNSSETQELINGTEEAARPAVDKIKRGVKAGVDEAQKNP